VKYESVCNEYRHSHTLYRPSLTHNTHKQSHVSHTHSLVSQRHSSYTQRHRDSHPYKPSPGTQHTCSHFTQTLTHINALTSRTHLHRYTTHTHTHTHTHTVLQFTQPRPINNAYKQSHILHRPSSYAQHTQTLSHFTQTLALVT
jgi:hypothetical protein